MPFSWTKAMVTTTTWACSQLQGPVSMSLRGPSELMAGPTLTHNSLSMDWCTVRCTQGTIIIPIQTQPRRSFTWRRETPFTSEPVLQVTVETSSAIMMGIRHYLDGQSIECYFACSSNHLNKVSYFAFVVFVSCNWRMYFLPAVIHWRIQRGWSGGWTPFPPFSMTCEFLKTYNAFLKAIFSSIIFIL